MRDIMRQRLKGNIRSIDGECLGIMADYRNSHVDSLRSIFFFSLRQLMNSGSTDFCSVQVSKYFIRTSKVSHIVSVMSADVWEPTQSESFEDFEELFGDLWHISSS